MISLKKYLDRNPDELLRTTLGAYRTALETMGNCGSQACPTIGGHLQQSLANLNQRLSAEATAESVKQTGEQVEKELHAWGDQAADYYRLKTGEIKEIMIVLAHTAEEIARRDQHYGGQLGEFTGQLESMAGLDDLTQIRRSLARSAGELKSCVTQMARETQESVLELRAELSTYQTRLEEADKLACLDELTGLQNRRGVEAQMESRIERGRPFTLVLLDLNNFKQVNDEHGHLAGDMLLKDFGGELRSAVRATDLVGRWGGDEYVVMIDGNAVESTDYVDRIRNWVFGDYTIHTAEMPNKVKVPITASIGTVTWAAGESGSELFARADAAMYRNKAQDRKTGGQTTKK
jgi:diguanylate cyclase (GGDEF)-like protein